MKALAKYHACNHCVIGEKKHLKNILIGPDKLPGLSRNGPPGPAVRKPPINRIDFNPRLKVNRGFHLARLKWFTWLISSKRLSKV